MNSHQSPQLFALLIGINDYLHNNVPDLRGCVKDIDNIDEFLDLPFMAAKFPSGIHKKRLTDSDATKVNIIKGFKEFLHQATPGDTALIYFSGHGVRERTNIDVFKADEFDGNISSLVCHDSNPQQHQIPELACLADKELRYLIHELAMDEQRKRKVNVVMIADCCHSGENTRAAIEEPFVRQVERRAFNPRSEAGFFFWEELKDQIAQNMPLSTILPEGEHIQMAACKDVELAQELPPEAQIRTGAFSSALLKVLTQFEGAISYDDLYSRVLNQMPTYTQSNTAQTPQIYLRLNQPNQQYLSFLTNQTGHKSMTCGVVYDERAENWRITAGALRAIPIDQKKNPTEVEVFKADQPEKSLNAHIEQVFPGYSIITFADESPDQSDLTYYARVKGSGIDPLRIFVTGADEKGVELTTRFLKDSSDKEELFQYEEQEENADYVFNINDGILFTTRPFDHERPLIQGIAIKVDEAYQEDKLQIAEQDLRQIANWTFLKKLDYSEGHDISHFTSQEVTMFPVEFRMYVLSPDGEERRVLPKKNAFIFDYPMDTTEDGEGKVLETFFRLELINHSDTDYFCSILYLSNLFGVSAEMMVSPQLLLGKDQQILSSKGHSLPNGKKYIKMSLEHEEYVKYFNYQDITYYFKMIVSKTAFDVKKLEMKSLPKPVAPNREQEKSSKTSGTRDIFSFEPVAPEVQWEVHTFSLTIMNPFFKPSPHIL